MADLLAAFELIESRPDTADFEGRKSDILIRHAEDYLSLKFPPTYRLFLSRYGAGDINGSEFYGVIGPNFSRSGIPDAIWLTKRERQQSNLPPSALIISAVGNGEYYCLDCSRRDGFGEVPVTIWTPGFGDATPAEITIASDFGEFLLTSLKK